MNSSTTRALARTATAVALTAGLAVCLTTGTAQADGGRVFDRSDAGSGRVILQPRAELSAAAAGASLTLPSTSTRLAGGAAARVAAEYSCPSGYVGYVDVQLVEVTGGHVAQGAGSNVKALSCNGAKHKIDISTVVNNDYPFKAGKAFSQAVLYSFNNANPDQDASAAAERIITLK
jgi:hypothetical protein